MPEIIELDKNLINKIAAGEVIERPASVVKELIENSMDSGATSITIEVVEGGKTLIKITDNGKGISAEELPIAIKRHATSKIKTAEDLFNISTLGFRGEALASIASISYMKITSKTAKKTNIENQTDTENSKTNTENADTAHMIEVEDSRIISNKPTVGNNGTEIEVHNLFFNVPARKKHQKSISAEFRHIVDIITRYILINPTIHFKLIHNNSLVINSPSTTNTLANVASVYGRSITKNLVPINFSFFDIEIMGFISKPELTRADRNYQSIYVNNRYIKNNTVQRAIYDAYSDLLFHGRHPVFILDMKIDPKKIDVNVHPQKSTIRIEKEQELYSAVKNCIVSGLMEHELIPKVKLNVKDVDTKLIITDRDDARDQATLSSHIPDDNTSLAGEEKSMKEGIGNNNLVTNSVVNNSVVNNGIVKQSIERKQGIKEELKIKLIGKLHNTYIIAQDKEGMLLVDQHAAHERVLYEKFIEQYKNEDIKVQELISPIVIEANPTEKIVIEENLELLNGLGITIEEFGKNTFIVRALPSILQKQQTPSIINDIIDELNNDEFNKISQIKQERIAMAACKSAVKAHDVLEFPQLYKLLEDLFKCNNPNTCPHGRPTIISIPLYELEKKFKRKM
ncbi:DNA mismatch repair endonuclease MutL [Candidatus Woesearchaeota archaeon]|jgi:DNA mismatch repair protein MutL|nr:DNA mismatch repair endonuclease MutL [Candidatus Woesearchaeota archaeon]